MRHEQGHSTIDVIMGIVLFSLVILTLYQVFMPTFALSRNTDERLTRQQDIRLVLDRVARDLHETTLLRLAVYDCTANGQNECLGFATARAACSGVFQLVGGYPNWQAVSYIWRDAASRELRQACDASVTTPAATWPAPSTFTVLGRELVQASFTIVPSGVSITLREQAQTAARPSFRYQTEFVNQTVFVPQNQ